MNMSNRFFRNKKYPEIVTEYILKDNGRNISRIDERHKFLYEKATQNTYASVKTMKDHFTPSMNIIIRNFR